MILLQFYSKWSKRVLNYRQFSSRMPNGRKINKQKPLVIKMSSILFLCLDFYWGRRWNEPQASCTACLQWGVGETKPDRLCLQNCLRAVLKSLSTSLGARIKSVVHFFFVPIFISELWQIRVSGLKWLTGNRTAFYFFSCWAENENQRTAWILLSNNLSLLIYVQVCA